ncbi:MAG: glycoside hydrolase family 130 protein [Anaerolineae bacterium]
MTPIFIDLTRYPGNPVLEPKPEHRWEARSVFNAAVIRASGLYHMYYRAVDPSLISSIGYAVSTDGLRWLRLDAPILTPQEPFEERGVEDPRVTQLEGNYYLAYTGYSKQGTRVGLARSSNLISWERMGIILPDENNKDVALFPERVRGRYALLHRRPPHIWIAYSDDLIHWNSHQILMRTRPGKWDSWRIGAGGPPIYNEYGWILIYHGVDERRTYRLGIAVLDLDDPTRIIYRQDTPILEPAEGWELYGDVPNVVFSCGQVEANSDIFVYYGAADSVIGVAIMDGEQVRAMMEYCRKISQEDKEAAAAVAAG